jgi:Oxidoreductase family, NAD-binding Rossmann fold
VALCDVYEPRMLEAAEIAGPRAAKHPDYRRLLDDKDVHAVLIGSPDHWHLKMTEDALAAGKDVYLEKPVSQTLEDGVALLKLASATKQVIQTGTQQRSWEHFILGKQRSTVTASPSTARPRATPRGAATSPTGRPPIPRSWFARRLTARSRISRTGSTASAAASRRTLRCRPESKLLELRTSPTSRSSRGARACAGTPLPARPRKPERGVPHACERRWLRERRVE